MGEIPPKKKPEMIKIPIPPGCYRVPGGGFIQHGDKTDPEYHIVAHRKEYLDADALARLVVDVVKDVQPESTR